MTTIMQFLPVRVFKNAAGLAAVVLLLAAPASRAASVYFIGNSVTDTIDYNGLKALAQSRGYTMPWGRHMIPGAPLEWIWDNPTSGFEQDPYGLYPQALGSFEWDFISLQPFDRSLASDETYARNFIDLALPQSTGVTVVIFARWPRNDEPYDTRWLRPLGDPGANNENKAFFEQLTENLRTNYPALDIFMAPVGHVMYELNQRIKADQVPGLTDIYDIYADGIHLDNRGQYLCALTYFTTIFREDPRGLSVPSQYGTIDASLVTIFQDTVLDVVAAHPLSGVDLDLPLEIGTSVLSPAIENIAYSSSLDANFGVTPFTWVVISNSLPSGISLSTNGSITGTSSALGDYSFTVQVTDSSPTQQTAMADLTLSVQQDTTPVITTGSLPSGNLGTPYSRTFSGFTATNGNGSLTWSVASNSLPTGLELKSSGVVDGSPQTTGTYNFVVQVTDSDSSPDSAQQSFSITVAGPESTTLLARKIDADVAIDGVTDEAFWSVTNSIDTVTGGSGGGLNEGANFDAVWDSSFLYVAARVDDSELLTDAADPLVDDGVHLFIDALHDYEAVFNADDRQFAVGPFGRSIEPNGRGSGILCAARRVTGGYTIELATPWSNLDLLPTDNLSIGFDLVAGDDTDGGAVDGHRALGATTLASPSPADFRDLLCIPNVDTNGSHAGLLSVESFDYSSGALNALNGGSGWAAGWDIQNGETNLPGYQASSSQPLSISGLVDSPGYGQGGYSYSRAGRRWHTGWDGPFSSVRDPSTDMIGKDGAEVWLAFLYRRDGSASVLLDLHQSATPWYGGSTDKIGLRIVDEKWALVAEGATNDTGVSATIGETCLMALRMNYGATDDVAIFMNPEPGVEPSSPTTEIIGSADLQFRSLSWYPGSDANQGSLDEIRAGTNYSAVVPTAESAPAILSEISGQTITAGASLSLPSDLHGNNLGVDWFKSGAPLAGQNGAVLNLTNASSADSGEYRFAATNRLGSVTGAVFQITVVSDGTVILFR